ncbi:MAG: hypothetical protein MI745_13195 [Pseudomonadales bacterium]|nr:hypothetical protein [Pseudomonadales bacterium]
MSDSKETKRRQLLKELDDIQSLLDDMEPPVLSPGDAQADQGASTPQDPDRHHIRRLASERANPFLSAQSTGKPAQAAPAPKATPRPSLSATDIEAVIDDLVADALPKLEKALRLKLREALRKKS